MIVWGGEHNGTPLDTGGRYNPSTDTWTATSTTGAPAPCRDRLSADLEPPFFHPSGYGASGAAATPIVSNIKRYCDVTGYVAPQNKFELKLPLPDDWNQKFFFYACGGFCGRVIGDACNLALARGYASATGNGGHDSVLGFDGIWAANAPELQEDFGWRSNHVVTLIAKAITTHYYGKPIKYSYMVGNSKGGQAVLAGGTKVPGRLRWLDAQRSRLRLHWT